MTKQVRLAAWRARLPDTIITGRPAICDWFTRHGFAYGGKPVSWSQVRAWERASKDRIAWRPRRGRPVTTHFVLLLWALDHAGLHSE